MSSKSAVAVGGSKYNGINTRRPAVQGISKLLFLGLAQASHVAAVPLKEYMGIGLKTVRDEEDPSIWLYFGIAIVLVLLGGAFAGLTIALMGQDGIYLQVIATSGEGREQKNADSVFTLLKKGKHWVLVTLLLSNVIVNETLPIVLDRSLGGGWPAVLGSTVLIVIFGEVIPQSICVRYGLQIGAFMAPYVLGLMYITAPVSWPTAKLLDYLLGEDHGTVYKKAGLKTLVTLHRTLGTSPTERLNQDEVTIISAVLDLKDKAVGDIMTPMEDVFTMSEDTILDEETMDIILNAGYSRIPIYQVGNPQNFTGMLLVKILITYDPEDCKKVSDFALATLPETRPETSCLDIVNFFQEGKSHMVLVSEYPGENYGSIGVVTLEDVIEELIGEEIIDESDVYIDVHKAIRRMTPAPKARINKGHIVGNATAPVLHGIEEHIIDLSEGQEHPAAKKVMNGENQSQIPATNFSTSPKTTFMRRSSAGADGRPVAVRGTAADMLEHLKHLGPSNLASRPKTTRYNTVKIKAGHSSMRSDSRTDTSVHRGSIIEEEPYRDHPEASPAPQGGEGEGLLKSAGQDAKDGVQALRQGYGSFERSLCSKNINNKDGAGEEADFVVGRIRKSESPKRQDSQGSNKSSDTLGSLPSAGDGPPRRKKGTARSGSITENIIEAGGIRKVVLETNTSSGEDRLEDVGKSKSKSTNAWKASLTLDGHASSNDGHDEHPGTGEQVKKRRRRNRKKKAKNSEGSVAEGSVDGSAHG